MPLFKVTKSHDAYVHYTTVVEAVNDEEATWIAGDRAYRGKWEEAGVQEFDAFDITDVSPAPSDHDPALEPGHPV